MTAVKEVYIVATESPEPLTPELLKEAFEAEEVELIFGEDGNLFSVRADDSRVDVKFDARLAPLGWTPDLLTGGQELREQLEQARGF